MLKPMVRTIFNHRRKFFYHSLKLEANSPRDLIRGSVFAKVGALRT